MIIYVGERERETPQTCFEIVPCKIDSDQLLSAMILLICV